MIAVVAVALFFFMLFLKLGVFTMEAFNNQNIRSMAGKAVEKNYLRDIVLMSPGRMLIYFISTCVVIPMEEEIFTRRLLYVSLRHKMGIAGSLIISSLVFGAQHIGAAAVPAVMVGVFLGWIYEKHQNLLVNIMTHGLINFLVILTMVFI
ncbi:MAG: CPBP family intramembrane glutamic endopeptidase [Elusimicrobiales bacterium]